MEDCGGVIQGADNLGWTKNWLEHRGAGNHRWATRGLKTQEEGSFRLVVTLQMAGLLRRVAAMQVMESPGEGESEGELLLVDE